MLNRIKWKIKKSKEQFEFLGGFFFSLIFLSVYFTDIAIIFRRSKLSDFYNAHRVSTVRMSEFRCSAIPRNCGLTEPENPRQFESKIKHFSNITDQTTMTGSRRVNNQLL